jgi:hypothetical protein
MAGFDGPDQLDVRLRVMRIINVAQVLAAGLFLAIVLILRAQGQGGNPPNGQVSLTFLAVPFCLGDLVAYAILPRTVVVVGRRRLVASVGGTAGRPGESTPALPQDRAAWYGLYQTQLIIRLALLQGCAFYLVIAYLQEGSPLILGAAVAFVTTMALHFPSRARVDNWVDGQAELAQQEDEPS